MDDLYMESFFRRKKAPSPGGVEEVSEDPALPTPPSLPKSQQQLQSSLWLLQQEVNQRFPHSFPMQKLLKQIEAGFASSDHTQALRALEKLEELIDVYTFSVD